METRPTRILLVEDDREQAGLIRKMLAKTGNGFIIDWVPQLAEGLRRLNQGGIDAVILDLTLPDSEGLDTFNRAYQQQPLVPYVVLTGRADEKVGLEAVRQGAQDYLIKGKVDGPLLSRSLRYAMERRRSQEALLAERQRLYALFDALPAAIYLKGPDHTVRFANQSFREHFGSLGDRRCYEIFHGRTEPCEVCPAIEVTQTQKCYNKEWTWPEKGTTYLIQYHPFSDVDGSPLILTLGLDITERKQAEEALRVSEERLRIASAAAHLGVFELDITTDTAHWENARMYEIFGRTPEEGPLNREAFFKEVLDPEDRPRIERELSEAIGTEKAFRSVCRIRRGNDGEQRWIENSGRSLVTGSTQRIIGVAADITERKQAEEAIKEREEQLATIYDNAPLIMMLVDADCRVRRVNKLAEQFIGAPAGELIGRASGEALRCLHALDDELGCGFGPHCQQCTVRLTVLDTVATGRSHHQVEACLPFSIQGKNQEVTFLLCTANIQVQGQPQVLVTIQDISDRKRLEEALRAEEQFLEDIFNGIQDGLSVLDLDRQVVRVNPAMKKFPHTDPMMGRKCFEVYHGRSCACEICPVTHTLATGKTNHGQVEVRDQSGARKFLEIYSYPLIHHKTGLVQGVIEYVRDVTQRQQAEEALKESEQKLRFLTSQMLTAQEDERKRLSQELHDELGHALLSMRLDLRAMEKQLLPEQIELAENISELMDYMSQVIENVRRLYLNLIPGDLEDLGLTAALRNLCEEFGRHQEQISWSVQMDNIDGLFPIPVQTAIYRIFQEILTNIGKHADPTRVSVSVATVDGCASFTIKDNGKGFDVHQGWQSSPKAGMGLLAIEERVRMLKGELQVWSRKNQGTEITFTIPTEA